VVDNDIDVLDLLADVVDKMGFVCVTAADGTEALIELTKDTYEIVIADIRMPKLDGMALLKEIKKMDLNLDVIMMTGFVAEFNFVDVIEGGATDFIAKPFPKVEIEAKIRRILRERNTKSELLDLSTHDNLTKLFNRRFFFQRVMVEMERARRQKHHLSCLLLDVDNFKKCNDFHGHSAGDQMLVLLSETIVSCIRNGVDCVCRYGGDEFAILLVETDLDQAVQIAERIQCAFGNRNPGIYTLSIGVAQLSENDSEQGLIRRADEAMYRVKRAGGNRVEKYLPVDNGVSFPSDLTNTQEL
jgi:diguanylate cyclase (GGDEF)-like protein